MPLLQDLTTENLKQFGIEGLSFTMPATTHKWANESSNTPSITSDSDTLSLSYTANNWLAPFSGIINKADSTHPLSFNLQKADGSMVQEDGAVLRLFPQQILRMKRLLALKFEQANAHSFERGAGQPLRQVPAFIFYSGSGAAGVTEGYVAAGEDLGFNGGMTFFDEQGYPLHPQYAASLVKSLLGLYPALDIDNALNNQLDAIIGTTGSQTVRLVTADGAPYNGDHIEGITAINAGIGLFAIDTYSGSDTSLKGELRRQTATAASGDFPPEKAARFFMGNITYCRMADRVPLVTFPASLAANTPAHDFFTVKVIETEKYLLGDANSSFNGTQLEPKPFIRLHQNLALLPTGNHIMGRLQTVFAAPLTEGLCAATAIDNTLPLPADEANVLWPQFPSIGGVTADSSFPPALKNEIKTNSRADFLPASGGGQPTDIRLKLTGIPAGAAIRVYNRVFLTDAIIKRGDGAGGVCTATVAPFTGRTLDGELDLVLTDPLGLKRPDGTVTVPTNPELIFDLMINLNDGTNKRLYGAITLPVQSAAVTLPPARPNNAIQPLAKKGICTAAILGLNTTSVTSVDFSSFENFVNSILTLCTDTQPRDACRLPTMARRDLLAASLKAGNWQALISGGSITGGLHNAIQDRGCPGTPGGKETSNTGIYTQQGQLAYDIGRMAFRRTTGFYDRIVQLADANWNEPAATPALGETEAPGAANGTVCGAVLQNIAPYCETPEFALLKTIIEPNISSIPATFDDLVNLVTGWINNINTGSLPGLLATAAGQLKTELVNRLNTLKDNNALAESDKERLYNELKRELSASCFGRRDTQWALQEAIRNARQFIYIETPGFSFTQGSQAADYTVDLVQELQDQLAAKPGLKLILCTPRQPDFTKKYDQWIRSEVKERFSIISNLPAKQVVAFHPIGFPGRPSNLEQTVVIADDVWALTGSSAFRRRGLTFDGSSDLVITDLQQSNGSSPLIKDLRIRLLKQRLGIPDSDTTSSRSLQLQNIRTTFKMIRETLVAGGLGKIERLWNGHEEGIAYADPTIDKDLANPDGLEFNTLSAAVYTIFTDLAL
ncbi:hypothetical protein [Niabella hirudinis]|uniref:hypothetical protein n=1 Tax=Niabella hirudinis TaxID=1285929 RepID=UPI003EB72CC2